MITLLTSDQAQSLIAEAVQKAITEIQSQAPALPDPEWVSNRSALKLLDVSPATLYRYRRGGLLPYSKVGHKVFYRLSDITDLLDCAEGGNRNA